MDKVRVVIVDDSPFSITIIKDVLEDNGIEVVGSAGTLEEVKEVVKNTMPSLVTMDMTLPGTDGLECTRAIHEISKDIKVIMISSMMDDEIVIKAKKNKINAYLQKPVDSDELMTTINRLMAADELYNELLDECMKMFKEALQDNMNRFAHELITYEDQSETINYTSEGVDIIIGIIGKFSGRMLLGFSKDNARQIATAALKREPKDEDEMTALLGEFTNIISGNACSLLNKKNKAFGLRVSPPSIMIGKNTYISPAPFLTKTIVANSANGIIKLNVGFARGEETWT
jgi:DNA-binding NarL/FixJ family response regulator